MKTLEEMKAELLKEARGIIIGKLDDKFKIKIGLPIFWAWLILFLAGCAAEYFLHNTAYILVPSVAFLFYIGFFIYYDFNKDSFFKKRISDYEINNEYKILITKTKENMLERKAEIPEELIELGEDYKKDLQELKNEYESSCEELKKEFGDLLEDYETICKLNETI